MPSLFRDAFRAAAILVVAGGVATAADRREVLRVCADPNNLPFSNARLEGFENAIATLVARDLGAKVEYTWRAQRRGFFRNTLKAGRCDVVMGVPKGFEMAATTRPYYRSSYVFVWPADRDEPARSLDDPALSRLRIGVQLAGDDYANTPPAHALSARGIVRNVVGFTLYGDYAEPNPPARILDAVAAGTVDLAIVWGPLAGYFAPRERVRLAFRPVPPSARDGTLPLSFDIAVGVRRGDEELRGAIDAVLGRRRAAIRKILDDYGVPRAPRVGP